MLIAGIALPVVALLALVLGALLALGGSLMLLGVAYNESGFHLLAVLFVPFYALFFIITRWEECRFAFLLYLLGILTCVGAQVIFASQDARFNRRSALADSVLVAMAK